MDNQYIIIDKIRWWVSTNQEGKRFSQPLCPKHNLRLRPIKDHYSSDYQYEYFSHTLKCEDCEKPYPLSRNFSNEKIYIIDKVDSKVFKTMKFINLDDEALPIAEDKKPLKDSKYFIKSILTESKVGKRLIVFVGEKGKKEKTEIFIEPDIKRLAFDQSDLHPTDIFIKLEATFSDGSKHTLEKNK